MSLRDGCDIAYQTYRIRLDLTELYYIQTSLSDEVEDYI